MSEYVVKRQEEPLCDQHRWPQGISDAGATVVIEDLAFRPEALRIGTGDTVTWTCNDGSVAHHVVGDDFRNEVMTEGAFRQRFDEPGTHEYVCSLHPNMSGIIEVTR